MLTYVGDSDMRDRTRNFLQKSFGFANSNAGGAIIGAGITYFFTRASREDELATSKANLELANKEITSLEQSLRDSCNQNSALLNGMLDKSNTATSARLSLERCERQYSLVRYAFNNSTCIFRQKYFDDVSTPKEESGLSTEKSNKSI